MLDPDPYQMNTDSQPWFPVQEGSGSDEDVDGVPLDGAALLKGARPLHTKPQPLR